MLKTVTKFADLKEVTSSRTVVNKDRFDPNGIFSQSIFNNKGMASCECELMQGDFLVNETCSNCGTIVTNHEDIGAKVSLADTDYAIINPYFVRILLDYNYNIFAILNTQTKTLDLDGNMNDTITYSSLLKDYETEMEKIIPDNPSLLEFFLKNKDSFFQKEFYVLPLRFRETNIVYENSGEIRVQIDLINSFYIEIINHVNNIKDISKEITNLISIEFELFALQNAVHNLNDFIIKDILSGKEGLFRSNILSNRINFSGRAAVTLRSDKLSPEGLTLPRQMFLEIYKLRVIYHIRKKLGTNLNKSEYYLMENRFNVNDELLNYCIETILANDDLVMMINRNPSLTHQSLIALNVDSINNGNTLQISKMILPPTAGDIDGDTMAVFTIETEEAKMSARKLFSLNSYCDDVYDNGNFPRSTLTPYQDNNMGLWLMNEDNLDFILGK